MRWFWTHGSSTTSPPPKASNELNSDEQQDRRTLVENSFISPHVIIPTVVLTTSILALNYLRTRYLVRIARVADIPPTHLPSTTTTRGAANAATRPRSSSRYAHRSIYGIVTSVGDADNFRVYHTPGGRLAGWGWLRNVPTSRREISEQTIHVRIAGIDAPELPHFGRPGQPWGEEALAWLKSQLLISRRQNGATQGKRVRCYAWRRDQYGRVVATVWVYRGWWAEVLPIPLHWASWDVGRAMLRAGWATVYEGGRESEFGGQESLYRLEEKQASEAKKGMWSSRSPSSSSNSNKGAHAGSNRDSKGIFRSVWEFFFAAKPATEEKFESPREFKTRMRESKEKQDKY